MLSTARHRQIRKLIGKRILKSLLFIGLVTIYSFYVIDHSEKSADKTGSNSEMK